MKKHFFNLRSEVLRNLDRAADQLAPPEVAGVDKAQRRFAPDRVKDVVGSVLFSLEAADDSILARVSRVIHEGYRLGGEQAMREAADATGAATPNPFNLDSPEIVEAMRGRDIQLRDVNKTLRRRLANRIADAVEEKQTIAQIQETVRSEFNHASNRSATIARTEVHGAVSEARQEGRRQAGIAAMRERQRQSLHVRRAEEADNRELRRQRAFEGDSEAGRRARLLDELETLMIEEGRSRFYRARNLGHAETMPMRGIEDWVLMMARDVFDDDPDAFEDATRHIRNERFMERRGRFLEEIRERSEAAPSGDAAPEVLSDDAGAMIGGGGRTLTQYNIRNYYARGGDQRRILYGPLLGDWDNGMS
ncbi:MAG: hypothetical protein WD009_14645 [Phycisphaeraceae bacterium]